MSRPKSASTTKKRAALSAASTPALAAEKVDDLAALDAWADAFQGVRFDEALHKVIGRFIVSATERRSLLDPFQVPFA